MWGRGMGAVEAIGSRVIRSEGVVQDGVLALPKRRRDRKVGDEDVEMGEGSNKLVYGGP